MQRGHVKVFLTNGYIQYTSLRRMLSAQKLLHSEATVGLSWPCQRSLSCIKIKLEYWHTKSLNLFSPLGAKASTSGQVHMTAKHSVYLDTQSSSRNSRE